MASFDSQMFTTIEPLQPVMWDALLDQRMIASYNQVRHIATWAVLAYILTMTDVPINKLLQQHGRFFICISFL